MTVKTFRLPGGAVPAGQFATAPDGDLWFAESSQDVSGIPIGGGILARITSSGSIKQATVANPTVSSGAGVAAPTSGGVEFSCHNLGQPQICRLTPTGSLSYTNVLPSFDSGAGRLAFDSTGATWFVSYEALGRLTAAGEQTRYPIPDNLEPDGIARGPGGIWFTATVAIENPEVHDYIGRFSLSGQLTLFRIPRLGSLPKQIVEGPDGNMWFAERGGIERVSPSGHFTRFRFRIPDAEPQAMAATKKGIWFSDDGTFKIGFMTLSGKVTEYRSGDRNSTSLSSIAVRPDGVWYQEIPDAGAGAIGHLILHR